MILCLETATKNCSVALFENGELIQSIDEYDENYSHSEKLTILIEAALKKVGKTPSDLNAIAVGKGPGSYTGLRIGVAVAKGMSYALDIPLLALDSCRILFEGAIRQYPGFDLYIPMIDARRSEVFMSVFNQDGDQIEDVKAMIIEQDSFEEFRDKRILLIGDGADKFEELFKNSDHITIKSGMKISASYPGKKLQNRFESEAFEDKAYFEPFYLKEFIAGKPRKFFS